MNDIGYIRVPEQPEGDCAARKVDSKAWQCTVCALAWDDGDERPKCARLTYARLIDAAVDEAIRIEVSQHALVAAGLRQYRNQSQLRRAMELRKLCEIVTKYKDRREERRR